MKWSLPAPERRVRSPGLPIAWALALVMGATPARGGTDFAGLLRPGSRSEIGLGGDPFRSPLRDESGWWAEPEFVDGPRVRVVSRSSEPLAEGVGAGGRLSAGATSWRVDGGTSLAGRPVWLTGRFSQLQWNGAVDAGSGELRLSSDGGSAEVAARIEQVVPGVSLQGTAPLWSDHGTPSGSGVGLRVRAGSWAAAQASWSESRRPEILRSDLQGEPVSASLNLKSEQLRGDARVRLPARVALELSAGGERYQPVSPRRHVAEYQLGPDGSSRWGQLSLEWTATPSLRVLARRTQAELDLDGETSWGGERFGQLNYARADLRSWLAATEARLGPATRVLLDVEHAEADGVARGVLESWPFTTALTDLLGLRRIGRAEAAAEWNRGHAGIERSVGHGAARVQLGASWFDLAPQASVESWRPAFLVFGRADYRQDRLAFHRAQLAAASFGLDWRLGSVECALAVEQFVFAKTFQTAVPPSAPSGPPAEPASPAGDGGGGWPGGTSFELSIGRRF